MEIFRKKCIPKNSQNSQEKTCAGIIVYHVYCNKKRARTHVIFCKKDAGMVVFCEFWEIFHRIHFVEHLRMTGSVFHVETMCL